MKNLILSLFLLSSFIAYSQTSLDLNEPIPVRESVKIGTLDNGLTYYIQQNAKPENKVELRLILKAGSILETDKQRGLAHFMEHMNFNGTKNFEHNDLVDYLQSIGVKFGQHLNAYTSFDETVYILPIPSDDAEKLEKGFDILEDWAFNNLLEPEEIDKERGVVLEELRLGLGADKRMLENYLPLLMYNSHYAERLPIGLKSVIENFDHKELEDFYKTWYRPDLMAVIVVGDIDVAEMEQKVKDHFASYRNPENAEERKEFYVPDHEETFVAIEQDKEAAFTQVQIMYKDPGNAEPDENISDYRQSLLVNLFNTMINNRMREISNNPNPPFTYGYSYHGSGWSKNKTSFQSVAMTSPENQLRSFDVLLTENERVKRFGFAEGELERAKISINSRLDAALKNKDKTMSGRIVWEYVGNFLEGEALPSIEWEVNACKELFESISVEEINALIQKYIHDNNRVVVFTGPETEEKDKVTEEQVLAVFEDVKSRDLVAYDDGIVESALMKDVPEAGNVTSKTRIDELDLTKLILSNGVTVYYKKTDFHDNEILLRAYSPGGSSLVTDHEEYKKLKLALGGLSEAGINNFSKNDMAKIMAGKNVSVSPFIGGNYEGFRGKTVNDDLETMFQMIYLNFTALNKDVEAYTGYVEKQMGMYSNLLNEPRYWFINEKLREIQKNNPRFSNAIPTALDFQNQDYDAAHAFYKDRFSDASDFIFLFVGSLEEEQLEALAKTYLGSLPSIGRKESFVNHDYDHLKGNQDLTFHKGKDPKSVVEIVYRTEAPYDAKQAYHLKCLGEILTIKLVENLREGESGVYGVGASGYGSKWPEGVYNFYISFPCGPENVEKLKKAALEELNKIVADGPDQKELDKIKEAQKLELKEQMKKNSYWVRQLNEYIYYGEDLTNILKSEEAIDQVTAEDIKKAANLYIGEDRIISILLPEE